MAWVTDRPAENSKRAATRAIAEARDLCAFATRSSGGIESGTRQAVGQGHEEGDRIVASLVQALASVRRAQVALDAAAAAASRIDTRVWVDDDPSAAGPDARYA